MGSDSGSDGQEREDDERDVEVVDDGAHDEALEELRANYRFAVVCNFTRLFTKQLQIRPFSSEQLEQALVKPEANRNFVGELHFKLLRIDAAAPFNERDADVWETLLYDKLNARWEGIWDANPMHDKTYWTLNHDSRLGILHQLCEWRLEECEAVRNFIKSTVRPVLSPQGPRAPNSRSAAARRG